MPNLDGVYELRFLYSTQPTGFALMAHVMTIDVSLVSDPAVGASFGTIETNQRQGSVGELQTDTETFMDFVLPLANASTTFSRAELWKRPVGSSIATFVSQLPLGLTGTALGNPDPAGQMTITFRSLQGGIARLQLMEPAVGGNTISDFPTGNTAANNLAGVVVSPNSPFVARDDSFLFVANRFSVTQNEVLYRKRFRP